ncbi:DUF169 domain-containing protein [Methanococcus aeolicus]|uniref:DUF169 domain-containing protein n=1 Tax=Methanococcus aeolicus TaxID=42879 RepID=UPI0021CA7EB5|nr:DUF169 domain-containing protein [Methanococcus aeolicus]UXM85559.1 DUF169 domain-containing protein [Methanococcus aeolicus]
MNIKELGKMMEGLLGLNYPAVAVKLAKSPGDMPEGYSEINDKIRHCEMIQKVRKEGIKFYATNENHLCKGGAHNIGVNQSPNIEDLEIKLHVKLGNFKTYESSKKTMELVPKIREQMYASVYAPLSDADFEPDSIVVITTPKIGLRLSQALLYSKGGRIHASFAGTQSLCGDAVAAVKLSGTANATLACNGSRKYAKIEDNEMVVAFPPSELENIIDALKHFREVWE